MFGSRKFLKKVASRDSEKSLGVGSVDESQAARTPGEILPGDNKVSLALYFVFVFLYVFVLVFVYVFVFGEKIWNILPGDNKVMLRLPNRKRGYFGNFSQMADAPSLILGSFT